MPFEQKNKDNIIWVRITQSELSSIPELPYEWCEEYFISYSYHTYGHLILGREENSKEYYIGIPDVYDASRDRLNKERIKYFKPREGERPRKGVFGYWIAQV